MKTNLTDEEIDHVIALYLPCMAKCERHEKYFMDVYLTMRKYVHYGSEYIGWPKLLLTPLAAMNEEKIHELCKIAAPEAYGDYRFSKWEISPSGKKDQFWNAVELNNKKCSYKIVVDLVDGEVRIYDDGDLDPTLIEHTYWQWYFKEGIAIPLYPWGETAIELGLAIAGP